MNECPEKHKSFKNKVLFVLVAVTFFAVGYVFNSLRTLAQPMADKSLQAEETVWTCSMHPQIRENKPGKCRICAMDLIPLVAGDAESGASGNRVISFSPEAVKLMQLQTSLVERKQISHDVRLVGKIAMDETRTRTITAWSPGRIERLFVDFTGIEVRPGDHMVEIYSPELITAQTEFLQTIESAKTADGSTDLVARSIRQTVEASREKLQLLGLTARQIDDIEQAGKPLDRLTIYAPIGGVVIDKMATEGMYLKTGTPIYTIADLSKLWVLLDVYESDLPWIQYGRTVEFTTQSFPGEVFTGRISFVSPVLDDKTRSVKVRAVVDNTDQKLKPNMLVHAVVSVPVTEEGPAVDPSLVGKWICPMHGEIIKDAPGQCDICQMDLVPAVPSGGDSQVQETLPLLVPASAVLVTGRKLDKGVVYVSVEGGEKPTFIGREVTLGPRAGDYYVIRSGLMEGERVVTSGNFKIDSEMQIQAKPSMMSPAGGQSAMAEHEHGMQMPETPAGEQTLCPVMNNPVDKEIFVEYEGKKVYFCCPGCIEEFEKDPGKYLPKLPQFQNEEEMKMEHNH